MSALVTAVSATLGRQHGPALHSLAPRLPETCATYGRPQTFLHIRCGLHAILLAIRAFRRTPRHSASPVPCKQTPSIRNQCAACLGGGGAAAEERKRGRLGKQSIYSCLFSRARPSWTSGGELCNVTGRAHFPVQSCCARAHTQAYTLIPHRGTSPALEGEDETERVL